jgi:hypothetical protein
MVWLRFTRLERRTASISAPPLVIIATCIPVHGIIDKNIEPWLKMQEILGVSIGKIRRDMRKVSGVAC